MAAHSACKKMIPPSPRTAALSSRSPREMLNDCIAANLKRVEPFFRIGSHRLSLWVHFGSQRRRAGLHDGDGRERTAYELIGARTGAVGASVLQQETISRTTPSDGAHPPHKRRSSGTPKSPAGAD